MTLLRLIKNLFNLMMSLMAKRYVCNIVITHDFNVDFLLISHFRESVSELYNEYMHKNKRAKRRKKEIGLVYNKYYFNKSQMPTDFEQTHFSVILKIGLWMARGYIGRHLIWMANVYETSSTLWYES